MVHTYVCMHIHSYTCSVVCIVEYIQYLVCVVCYLRYLWHEDYISEVSVEDKQVAS